MTVKGVLLGTAAALAVVSGAQAADAIVAAAPEPAEYVRVCDAFGTGYFYIPGTETCLKISGYVRAQVDYSSLSGGRNWNARTRGLVTFAAKNDSELGTVGSTITLRAWQGGSTTAVNSTSGSDTNSVEIDEAFITVGGFQVGSFYNYWDTGLSGDTTSTGSNRLDAIAYNYKAGNFFAGIAVDETNGLSGTDSLISDTSAYTKSYNVDRNVGIEGQVGGTFGPATTTLLGGYDFNTQNFAVRDITSVNVGPGVLEIAGIYSNGVSTYYDASKWSVAADYAAKITDKLTLTPGVQYFGKTQVDASGDYFGRNIVRGGLTVDYKLAAGLAAKVQASYQNKDASGNSNVWTGYVRLQRSF